MALTDKQRAAFVEKYLQDWPSATDDLDIMLDAARREGMEEAHQVLADKLSGAAFQPLMIRRLARG